MSLSASLSLNANGTIQLGNRIVPYHITPTGDLVFPGQSRAGAMAVVETIDQLINRTKPLTVEGQPLLPAPALTKENAAAAPVSAEVAPVAPKKLARDGTTRGRPPKPSKGG